MSSFEPLFGATPRSRRTPLATARIDHADRREMWMPVRVEIAGDRSRRHSDTLREDERTSEEARHIAIAAAEAQARQDTLDAAYSAGFDEGRMQGELAEAARLRAAMTTAESALDDVRNGEVRWLANLEENIAALAVGIAQQIVAREVSVAPDVVVGLVQRAIQEFSLDQPLSIRLNPADLTALQSIQRDGSDAVLSLTAGRDARWTADSQIEPGGCVVEGRERIVDGRVDTALERLYRRLTYTNA